MITTDATVVRRQRKRSSPAERPREGSQSNGTRTERIGRARAMLAIVSFGLFMSGVTIWPAAWELKVCVELIWGNSEPTGTLHRFIVETIAALEMLGAEYPFLLYGYDWLAFAHIVLAILFAGAIRDPVPQSVDHSIRADLLPSGAGFGGRVRAHSGASVDVVLGGFCICAGSSPAFVGGVARCKTNRTTTDRTGCGLRNVNRKKRGRNGDEEETGTGPVIDMGGNICMLRVCPGQHE